MRSFFIALTVALFVGGCGKEDPDVLGNNDDSNNANHGDPECRTDGNCDEYFVCEEGSCVEGPCLDGKLSLGESAIDCGGQCPGCELGEKCNSHNDCASAACDGDVCVEERNGGTNNNVNNNTNCEDPGDTERFVLWDNGITADIMHDGNTRSASVVITSGIGIADLDDDGDNDVIVTSQGDRLYYFENDGSGSFTDSTDSVGLGGLTKTTSVSIADIDGDGDLDLLIGRTEGAYVLENELGAFTDETAKWGIGNAENVVAGAAFADFDGDGDLDVYLANYVPPVDDTLFPDPLPNRLYRNDSDTFTELSVSPGSGEDAGATLAVAWWDFDEDGMPDIWVGNDFGMIHAPNQLYRNVGADAADPEGWLFEDIAPDAGLDTKIFSMSATLADFDNDGDQDGYTANMANNVLHVKSGMTTTNESVDRGVACGLLPDPMPEPIDPPEYTPYVDGMEEFFELHAEADSEMYTLTSWSSIFFDANHDGWQDLYVVNGTTDSSMTPEGINQPNRFFVSNGDGTFEQAPCWFMPDIRGTSRGAAAGDLDGDGDFDLVWVDTGDFGDPGVYVLRNDVASGNWLSVALEGDAPNTEGIGAKITLTAGGESQTRWIDGGQTFMSVSERAAHFGLGSSDAVDELVVEWPSGESETVPVDAVNQRLVIQQTE